MNPLERRNSTVNLCGEAFWGFQMGLTASATVLVVILRMCGAGRTMIGSISTLEAVTFLLTQVFGVYLFRSRHRFKRRLICYHYVCIIPAIAVMGLLLLLSRHLGNLATRCLLLAVYAIYTSSCGVIGAVWLDWLARIFRVEVRGTVIGMGFCGSALMAALGSLAAGAWIGRMHGVSSFGILYLAASVLAVVSISVFWLVNSSETSSADLPPSSLSLIASHFRESMSDWNFRAFLIGRILATAGFCILPLIADYYASPEGGGVRPGVLVSCGAAMTAGVGLGQIGLGRVGDLYGHRFGLIVSACFQIVALTILLTGSGLLGCVCAYFFAGLCGGAVMISHFNMVFETCPHDNRTAHIVVANMVVGAGTFLMPTIAGWVAAHLGTRTVFGGCLVLSAVALAWIILKVRDPRTLPLPVREGVLN